MTGAGNSMPMSDHVPGEDLHTPQSRAARHLVAQHADTLAGHHPPGEQRCVDAGRTQQLPVQLPRAGIHQLRGGEDRIFAHLFARKQVRQRVGHEEHMLGGRQRGAVLAVECVELVERIEIHHLNARLRIDAFARHRTEKLFRHSVGIGIAVGARKPQQIAVGIHAGEIDAPRIDADRVDPFAAAARDAQSPQNLLVEGVNVPIEAAVDLPHTVRETVQLLHSEPVVPRTGQNHPTAGSAQVDTDYIFLHNVKKRFEVRVFI